MIPKMKVVTMAHGNKVREEDAVLYVRGLPTDLKAHFKGWCAQRGLSMKDGIAFMMRQAISGKVPNEVCRRTKKA